MACFLGLLAHLLVFRPLRNAPALGKVIGAVGIMLYLQSVASLNFGGEARQNPGFLPGTTGLDAFFKNFLGLGNLPHLIVWMAGCAVVMGAAVWALLRFTRFGLATRAADENEKGASLLGLLAAAPRRPQLGALGRAGRHHRPRRRSASARCSVDRFTLYVIPALRRRSGRQPHLDPAGRRSAASSSACSSRAMVEVAERVVVAGLAAGQRRARAGAPARHRARAVPPR